MTALLDGQYAYRGLVFGAGTDLLVTSAVGLEGMTVRNGDRPLPRSHGAVPGPHYTDVRQPILTFTLDGSTAAMDAAAQRLADTFGPQTSPLPLEWKRPGRDTRLVYARPLAVTPPRGAGIRQPKVALTCADPRIYTATPRQISVPLYQAAGGRLDYPGDYPKDYPAGVSLDVVASNAGAADAYPLIRFYGPTDGGTVTSVILRNLTTGETQTITTPITAGQILTVDNSAYITGSGALVVALDTTSRYGAWQQPRLPLRLPPGDSILRFETTGTSTAVACVLTWADTWLS